MEQPRTTPPTGPEPPGVAGVVAAANAQLSQVDDVLWAARTPEEIVATVEQIERTRSHLEALKAALLTEVEDRDLAKHTLAWGSTADWYTHTAGTHHRTGRRTVRQAPILVAERTATHRALCAGEVSPEQAAVIVDAVDKLPHDQALRAQAERLLLDEAAKLDATALTAAGKKIASVVDPDGEDRKLERELAREARAAHHRRFLALTPDGAGGVHLTGRGTLEDAAILKAALLPLTKPSPAVDPDHPEDPGADVERDPRDHGARLWDALVTTCQHALDTDLPPESHGARPRLAITIDYQALRDSLLDRIAPDRSGPDRSDPGPIDWTALPTRGCGLTEDGAQLPAATVRRLACDADLIPVTLGTRGQVLDVGRTNRLVTPALWTALVCRDHHCAFPGCTRPPVMCQAHHILHWADGGTTALDNLVLVCGHHHRTLHHTPWQVRLHPADGRPEFRPPPRHGTEQPWTRHRPRRE